MPLMFPSKWATDIQLHTNVKAEFGAPCSAKYKTALNSIKFLCQFHNCDAIFESLRKDIRR